MLQKQIDYLNIGLIVISFITAIFLPFKLFLFAYAILGPLHYLTEINWLEQQQFFTKRKTDVLILIGLTLIGAFGFIYSSITNLGLVYFPDDSIVSKGFGWLRGQSGAVSIIIIGAAIAFAFYQNNKERYLIIGLSIICGAILGKIKFSLIVFVLLLPTLVHVWLFTGLFMFYGAKKSNSTTGYLAVIVLALCSLLFLFVEIPVPEISEVTQANFKKSSFDRVSFAIAEAFNLAEQGKTFYFKSPAALKLQAFIAFAYTYHYLNWFSKTKIIEWHKTTKTRASVIITLWLCSIFLYWYDYQVGLLSLYMISLLHVYLELPLNMKTLKALWS